MTAAAMLNDLDLPDGWKVIEHFTPLPTSTGGLFSHSYLATKDGKIAFLKAFDFSDAFTPGTDTLKILGLLTASYEHERDVLDHCRRRRLSHVALAIGHGYVDVPGLSRMEGRVYFLLFEKADGDIRRQMDEADTSDAVWCMRALRHACLGLWQMHREMIAHQDLKPSNILSYNNRKENEFRVADLGRSSRRGRTIWHDTADFPGDQTYAPPELLYGHVDPDFVPRRMGTDLYMLGNLAAFLFSGTNVTESLMARMDPRHHWAEWQSDYASVLPYVQEAFGRFLEEFKVHLTTDVQNYVLQLVSQLCNPDLSKRGHPRGIGMQNQYSLERYVSVVTRMVLDLQVSARTTRTKT